MNSDTKLTKKCIKCLSLKKEIEFPIRCGTGKLRNECKVCIASYKKQNKFKNKEHIKKNNKLWYENNKTHVLNNVAKYANKNRELILSNKRAFYEINKTYFLEKNLKKKFNISLIDYEEMLKSQNGLCAICKKPETGLNNTKKSIRRLAVDHCHKTGKVRGLLCGACNNSLGLLKENIETFENAISYLRRSKGE